MYQVLWEPSAREDFLEEVIFDVDPEGWIAVKAHIGDKWMERGFLCKRSHHEGKYQGIQGGKCVENDVMDVYPLYYPGCSSGNFLLGHLEQRTTLFLWILPVSAEDVS